MHFILPSGAHATLGIFLCDLYQIPSSYLHVYLQTEFSVLTKDMEAGIKPTIFRMGRKLLVFPKT